ncbi:peroxiredoxin-6 isoform X2 [Agrilus planipennis]|uniref:thioredoxin-dependent peroxiredoxin n=1 Tax=Agrilus planipennis TaxID=224129 RepID=A0A1W4XAZ6_AGRPL|nr:peroxiredoxin-6 isoform X2 [Agrilus planipennis]
MVNLGDTFPNFTVNTTVGPIHFHEWIGDSWVVLFSHPADFTPVCTTELARSANLHDEFQCRNVKLIAVSCDSVEAHKHWITDINFVGNIKEFPFPIISDEKRELAVMLNMIDPDEKDSKGMPLTARAVFVIDPLKKLRLSILYPANVGRNFKEILRVVDALQLSDKHKVATPADWKKKMRR